MSTAPDSSSQPPRQTFLQHLAQLRQMVATGRSLLPAHAEFKPDWDQHLERIGNLERLFQQSKNTLTPLIQQLHEDFMLHYQADMATTMSETKARFVRFTDMVAQKFEEKKFELPSEARDSLEDLLQPYHDIHRDKMLSELPLEERRAIEAAKRQLDEEE
ncbi:MAG: hypothetical protein ABL974_00565 [Prosthecobacter sp.]